MKKIQIELTVSSTREAEVFYCTDLGMFSFYQDYGMGHISLVYNANPSLFLILREGVPSNSDTVLFHLEVDNCESVFNTLKNKTLNSNGVLLSDEVFAYPLSKSILLKDPSHNKFSLYEDYDNAGLESYYSGDAVWNNLLSLAATSWIDSDLQKELTASLNNHIDIAKVMYAILGDESIRWIHRKIPALDNLTPKECLENPRLLLRLKEGLMRMDV